MVIFHSYVSLPEGNPRQQLNGSLDPLGDLLVIGSPKTDPAQCLDRCFFFFFGRSQISYKSMGISLLYIYI